MKIQNSSPYPTDTIRAFIKFICGRLPVDCEVRVLRCHYWGRGRGWAASKRPIYTARGRSIVRRGGGVFVKAPAPTLKGPCRTRAHGGYLPRTYFTPEERLFAILAHEIRHVQQGFEPLARGVKKIRRHNLGTCGKLIEVDACLYETRALRRFRREWPRPSPAVLPLP